MERSWLTTTTAQCFFASEKGAKFRTQKPALHAKTTHLAVDTFELVYGLFDLAVGFLLKLVVKSQCFGSGKTFRKSPTSRLGKIWRS